eukprot:TRINITY_DN7003_c0_g1_i8.p1 TRINITY_DN7003_c0_g1~~TRINITY_DN7003_c0_g1_i8.p1  ORF type:complete len:366 (+),score=33.90 TRINITY_DN7003_c0_g1_i8:105-1202(+)
MWVNGCRAIGMDKGNCMARMVASCMRVSSRMGRKSELGRVRTRTRTGMGYSSNPNSELNSPSRSPSRSYSKGPYDGGESDQYTPSPADVGSKPLEYDFAVYRLYHEAFSQYPYNISLKMTGIRFGNIAHSSHVLQTVELALGDVKKLSRTMMAPQVSYEVHALLSCWDRNHLVIRREDFVKVPANSETLEDCNIVEGTFADTGQSMTIIEYNFTGDYSPLYMACVNTLMLMLTGSSPFMLETYGYSIEAKGSVMTHYIIVEPKKSLLSAHFAEEKKRRDKNADKNSTEPAVPWKQQSLLTSSQRKNVTSNSSDSCEPFLFVDSAAKWESLVSWSLLHSSIHRKSVSSLRNSQANSSGTNMDSNKP